VAQDGRRIARPFGVIDEAENAHAAGGAGKPGDAGRMLPVQNGAVFSEEYFFHLISWKR
jgi:hypothetical protein